eukprot:NODE_326_length_10940_cov_0.392122.p2 type:complete len:431 gc:universal NODE_326_length_10940_cov_0.392122:7450-6158(-)
MLILFQIISASLRITHVSSNQILQAPRIGNQYMLYNQEIPSDGKDIASFEVCDIWSARINGTCVQCDTTNGNKKCVDSAAASCPTGYIGDACKTCSIGFYRTSNGCAQCLMPFGPLYTYSTFLAVLWIAFMGSGYAAHFSLLVYVVKTAQLFVALSSLSKTDLYWMTALQTFVLDPLAVQWECFGITTGYAPLMGLIMVGGFWVANLLLWGVISLYILFLDKVFPDLLPPDIKKIKDSSIGAWTFYLEWQSPILVFRFVQGLQQHFTLNFVGLIVILILLFFSFFSAKWIKAVIFPGTIPFIRYGPAFYKLKPSYFYFYLINHMWWAVLALNTFLYHPYLQRIIIVVALLSRSLIHFFNVFKRPITWYGEVIVAVAGMLFCFAVDKPYSFVIVILTFIANFAILGVEISWCHGKKWAFNSKPEVVIILLI